MNLHNIIYPRSYSKAPQQQQAHPAFHQTQRIWILQSLNTLDSTSWTQNLCQDRSSSPSKPNDGELRFMVLELRVLLSKRSSHLNCYHPLRYQPWILSKGNLPRANTMARVDQGYLSSLSKRYSRLNHYETFCSLKGDFAVVHYEPYCSHSWNLAKGRFYYGSLWTLLLPLLESYQWEIFMWFAMNLTAPTLRILPRRDFSVVRYEPYCSHSWNFTKGRFYC